MPGPPPGYQLDFEDTFDADVLDERLWVPYYLPHWSSRARTAARLQFMLDVYELPGEGETAYPKVFTVDYVRGYRAPGQSRYS